MEVKIEYSVMLGRRCAQTKIGSEWVTASGDTWQEAKTKLLGQVRDLIAIDEPPEPETVEI